MADIDIGGDFLRGFQVGSNLALNAERMRQQREETRMQAQQLMQQIQAARALDAYRAQEQRMRQEEALANAQHRRDQREFDQRRADIADAVEKRAAGTYSAEEARRSALEDWQRKAIGRIEPEPGMNARREILAGAQGPISAEQASQYAGEKPEAVMREGALLYPKEYGSMARSEITQQAISERQQAGQQFKIGYAETVEQKRAARDRVLQGYRKELVTLRDSLKESTGVKLTQVEQKELDALETEFESELKDLDLDSDVTTEEQRDQITVKYMLRLRDWERKREKKLGGSAVRPDAISAPANGTPAAGPSAKPLSATWKKE